MRSLGLLSVMALLALPATWAAAEPVSLIWDFSSGGEHIRCLGVIEGAEGHIPDEPDVLVSIAHTGDPQGHFRLLRGADGSRIWGVSPTGGASDGSGYGDMCVNTCPDLNGDGLDEVLFGTSWGGRTAYTILADEGGAVFWDFDTYVDDPPSGWIYSLDWIPDVTGDGVPEIVFGCGSDNNNAYCVNGATGTVVWRFAAPDAVYQVARIGDVNLNGTSDVLIATGDNSDYTYCIDGGSPYNAVPIWSYDAGASCFSVTGIGDVNDDLIPDAVIGTWNTSNGVVCVSGADGSYIWNTPMPGYVMRVVTSEDLDDDGYLEVLVASWDNRIICLSGRTGATHWSVPVGTTNGGDVWAIWPMGDVDLDGYDDVIAGSFDLKAYCVSGRSGALLWDYTVGNRVYTVRSIKDVNLDGTDDALIGTQYMGGTGGKVFCLDANGDDTSVPPVEEVACRVEGDAVIVSWDFDEFADLAGFNVYRGTLDDPPPVRGAHGTGDESIPEMLARRAGIGSRSGFAKLNDGLLSNNEFVDTSVVDGMRYAYMVGAVAADGEETLAGPVEIFADLRAAAMWLAPPRPNPCRTGLTVEFAVPAGVDAAIAVYDPAGRLVRRLVSRAGSDGTGSVTWDGLSGDGAPVASGVYLVRMGAGPEILSRKVVVLR